MAHGKSRLFRLVVVLVLSTTTIIRATTETEELEKHDHPSTVTEKIAEEIDDRRREGEEGSWTTWAKDKISDGLGFKYDDDSATKHAEEAVGKAKDDLLHTASETGKYGADKAGDIKEATKKAGEKTGKTAQGTTGTASDEAKRGIEKVQEVVSGAYITGKAGEGKEAARDKTAKVKDSSMEEATDAASKAKDATEKASCEAKQKATESEEKLRWAKEKAQEGYDAAKAKAGENLDVAKETLSSGYGTAKQKSEEVKEKIKGSTKHTSEEL